MDRRRTAVLTIAVVVATSVGGFLAGSRIASPAEIASRTAAPDPALVLVPIEERVLSTEVVTRGTGRFGSPQKLSVPTSALKPGAGLVAEVPVASTEIVEGDVVLTGSGRPLFLLVGERPMSRDLGPGLSGDDVLQLEEALIRLGFHPGPADGAYDDVTELAVQAWYLASGYSPFTATDDQLAAIRAREADLALASFDVVAATDAVTSAEVALTTAQAAASTAARRSDVSARAVDTTKGEADAANAVAQREVAAKQATLDALRSGQPAAPATQAQLRAAESDLLAARSNAATVRSAGQRAVAAAQTDVDQAPARLEAARLAAAAADRAAAADVAAKQAAFDEVAADPTSTPAQLAAAHSDLTAAQMLAADILATGMRSVAESQAFLIDSPKVLDQIRAQAAADNDRATADVAARELALDELRNPRPPTAAEIASADSDLAAVVANAETVRIAGLRAVDDASNAAADAAGEVAVAAAAAAAAEASLANARAALRSRTAAETLAAREADLARRRAGVQVPADEVVFVSTGPVRVASLLVALGDPVAGAVATVTNSVVHVDAGLALADAALVTVGMMVELDEPELGIAAEGVVSFVAAAPGTNGVDGFHVYVEIDVAAPPTNLVGASVRLTIPVTSTGDATLAVPVSAVTLAADGSSQIQRSAGGVTEFVPVTLGLSAAGYVEISAVDRNLQAGEMVVIGVARG